MHRATQRGPVAPPALTGAGSHHAQQCLPLKTGSSTSPHFIPSQPLTLPSATGAGFGNTFRLTKNANAYMLVYVRESEWDTVMCQVTEQDISDHVRARLKVRFEGPAGGLPAGWSQNAPHSLHNKLPPPVCLLAELAWVPREPTACCHN